MTTENTYLITSGAIDRARAIIAKAAKKATRLGLEPITYTEGPLRFRYADRGDECVIPLTLTSGAALTYGWSFIARIDHIGDDCMIFAAPGEEVPAAYRTRCACDHCHTARRRAQTYIVRAPAAGCPTTGTPGGTYRQIGRNCLGAYIGEQTAAYIMAQAALLCEIEALTVSGEEDEGGGGGGGRYAGCDPVTVVALAVALYTQDGGYISRSAAENSGLASHASEIRRQLFDRNLREDKRIRPTAEQVDAARASLAWAAALPESSSDYLYNLRTLGTLAADVECWPTKAIGLGASIYAAHRRAIGEEVRRARLAALPASTYLGEVGGKITDIPATVTRTHVLDGQYDAITLICFTAVIGDARHDLIWFASNAPEGWVAGAEVRLDAKVKRHEADRRTGAAVTTISHAKPAAPPKAPKAPKAKRAPKAA